MACIQCSAELAAGSKFCHVCGTPQLSRCAFCSTELQADARFCSSCGKAVGTAGVPRDLSSGGLLGTEAERRQLTVMFCDLAGSTELSRRLDAEDLRALVKAYQRAAATEVERFGGHVAQYLGDGILVYFGYPQAHEDAASRAIAAAMGIVQAVGALSAETQRTRGVQLDVRIGMHSGVVVIGDMGGGGYTERLAIGDAPNIAARIQDKAPLNQVLISGSTARLAERRYISVALGDFELKGIDYPVTLYKVTGERDLDVYLHEQVGEQVNRHDEIATLLDAWQSAVEGRGRAVLVTGEAGIGKSSMLEFLRRKLGPAVGSSHVELRFSEHHRQSAYYAFAGNLRRACRFESGDDDARRVAKLVDTLRRADPELESHLGVYAALLGVPLPADVDHGPMPTKPLTNAALVRWVLAQGRGGPTLVQVEDLHWADPSSLEVLVGLLGAIDQRPILAILTARTEFEPPWSQGESVTTLPLGRLGRDHITEIIANTARGERISPRVMSAMLERIDGVPIFAEELTKTVLEAEDPEREDGAASGGGDEPGSLAIPATLHDSLMARIDRSGPYRGVVQMCAVLGRDFEFETLQALTALEEDVLEGVLDELTQRQIIFRTGAQSRRTYAFRHALVQDVAYESLLRSDRAGLHRKVGELLESRSSEPSAGLDGGKTIRGLAYHWGRAVSDKRPEPEVVSRAVGHLINAGERELMLSGYREAASHLEQALGLLANLPAGPARDALELTVRTRISTVLKATVGPAAEEVRVELERSHQLCKSLGDRPELGTVLYSFWQLNLFRALYPESLRYARLCLAEAERSGDPDMLIQSYVALSNTYFWFCDLADAEESYKKVLEEYDPTKHGRHALFYGMDPGVLALMFGTWVPQLTGRWNEAAARHAEVERLSAELQHPMSMALALNTSCCYHVNRGDAEGARRAGQAMVDLARTHGLFVYEIIGVHFRGWGAARLGQAQDVLDEVRGTYHNYVTYVGGLAQTYIAMLAAGVFEAAGEIEEAIVTLERALESAEASNCRELAYHAELTRARGQLLAQRGDLDAAEAAYRQAFGLATERGQPPFALRAALGLFRLAQERGADVTEARALVADALSGFAADEVGDELTDARTIAGPGS